MEKRKTKKHCQELQGELERAKVNLAEVEQLRVEVCKQKTEAIEVSQVRSCNKDLSQRVTELEK